MDPAKKVKFCQLIRESQTIEHAAEWVDVSIRTVQRERKRDEDFDHEVRLALQATPDPLTLMENAARTHWRAAAWLLERTRPEEFARQPANTARDYQVEAALHILLEAALAATAPAERLAFYEKVEPICTQALQYCFPQLGPNGNLKKTKLPPTPLADDAARQTHRDAVAASQTQAAAQLSPKTHQATPGDTTPSDTLAATRSGALSPDTSVAKEPPLAVDDILPIDFNLRREDFAAATAVLDPPEQPLLWDQRLRHFAALKRRQERQAVKRQKSAKKRAAANRRRNAA